MDAVELAQAERLSPKPRTRKAAKASPTARTLAEMRKRGYPFVEVVEKTIRLPGGRMFKRDLFGGFDVIALGKREGAERAEVVLVQTTSASNVASRLTKISELPALPALREANVRLLVHGWDAPTKTRRLWRLREEDIS